MGDQAMRAGSGAQAARAVGAFFDELSLLGVREVVVAPGSRSTPLAMAAYELSRRAPERMRVTVDVDERGAAFLALGIAKATGVPACVVCTSGTAVANFFPAVLEAESSRVPLLVLTGDRPARLQGLGAPQTCDQLNAFGTHVAAFRQMPALGFGEDSAAFARQVAREALIAAGGGAGAGLGHPVHLNFPFDEPLTPDISDAELFSLGRGGGCGLIARPRFALAPDAAERIAERIAGARVLVCAGEGSVRDDRDAYALLAWAKALRAPVLADPLSGLRRFADAGVIDNYDNVFARKDWPRPDAVVRFGRWPVSKRATTALAAVRPVQVVVDPFETRDFNAATDVFAACAPWEFVRATGEVLGIFASDGSDAVGFSPGSAADAFFCAWAGANDAERARIEAVDEAESGVEGAFVRAVVDMAPDGSCLFMGNSMAIRALDTFYTKRDRDVRVLCNRGLNGIDGTVSSAVGAASAFAQTTLVIGDVAMLHDINALALQRELVGSPAAGRGTAPAVAIVLLNNNGGAIFDMLPQQSEQPYFERLFLTPQDVDFESAARAFSVPFQKVRTVAEFRAAYAGALGVPGISMIEVSLPLSGVKERYGRYW